MRIKATKSFGNYRKDHEYDVSDAKGKMLVDRLEVAEYVAKQQYKTRDLTAKKPGRPKKETYETKVLTAKKNETKVDE